MLSTSSSPAAAQTAREEKASGFTLLRQLLVAFLFDIGLCASGRHLHNDPVHRQRCCNGFRISRRWTCEDGELLPLLELRPITAADPRFAWEAEPSTLPEMHSSINPRFLKKPGHMPGHDRPFGPPRLTLVERDFAAGRLVMKRSAQFRVESFDPERLVIRDLGPWSIFPSVTNDAEGVLKRLSPAPGQRVFYYDSEGQLDELVHENGRFVRFAPGPREPTIAEQIAHEEQVLSDETRHYDGVGS